MNKTTKGTFLQRNEGRLTPEDINEYYKKLNEKNQKSVTDLDTILPEAKGDKLIDAIEIQFARKDPRMLSISHKDLLDLYTRIYEDGLRKFNFVELGILSDMFFIDYPSELVEEHFNSIKDYLRFKVDMEIIPRTYHAINMMIDSEITEEMKIRKQLTAKPSPLTPHK